MIGREKGKEPLECYEDILEVTDPHVFWEVMEEEMDWCDNCGQPLLENEICPC